MNYVYKKAICHNCDHRPIVSDQTGKRKGVTGGINQKGKYLKNDLSKYVHFIFLMKSFV